jgi:hypothetical protein
MFVGTDILEGHWAVTGGLFASWECQMKKMLSKVWKFAASGLGIAALTAAISGAGSESVAKADAGPSFQPPAKRLVLQLSKAARLDQANTMQDHYSHVSHGSHASHASHYSGR